MFPLLPGAYGLSLGFFQAAAPASAEDIPTLIGQAIPKGTLGALVQVVTQNVSWRDDGVAPTATAGMLIYDAAPPVWFSGAQLGTIKLIQVAAGAATINISFYGA